MNPKNVAVSLINLERNRQTQPQGTSRESLSYLEPRKKTLTS